jgi:hypothetical protein
MKKIIFLVLSIISFSAKAQLFEIGPNVETIEKIGSSAMLNPDTTEFLYNLTTTIGSSGNAGIVFINNQFWISAWASSNIHILNSSGTFVETFSIAGVTGIRSFTTDGTNIYAGTNTNSISVINPVSRTLTSTISTSLPHTVRFLTYDSTLNSDAGGFWTGNFNTDLIAVSMSGSSLITIPAATHGMTGMYGIAINPATNTLYVYAQMPPYNDTVLSLSLPSGIPTGLVYDVFTNDLTAGGTTSSLAGGTFLSSEVVPGETTLIGVSQATPNNMLWGINIDNLLADEHFEESGFSIYPNPIQNTLHFTNTDFESYIIFTIDGKEVHTQSDINLLNTDIDVSQLSSGIYFISLKKGNKMKNFKFIKN